MKGLPPPNEKNHFPVKSCAKHIPTRDRGSQPIDVDSRCQSLFLPARLRATTCTLHSTHVLLFSPPPKRSACDLEVLRRMIPRFSSEATKHLATHAAGIYPLAQCLDSSHIIDALILPHSRNFALVPSSHHYHCSSGICYRSLAIYDYNPVNILREKRIISSPVFAARRHLVPG